MRFCRTALLTALIAAASVAGAAAQSRADFNRNMEKIGNALTYIYNNYVDTVDLDKIVDRTIEEMMSQLDPHSAYRRHEETVDEDESLNGAFEGVGVEFAIISDTLTVQSVVAGGPSEAVGIRAGDKIVAIDGEDITSGLTNDGVRRRLRGPAGTKVTVDVVRGQSRLQFAVTRDRIPIESLDAAYSTDDGIFYVKMSRFSQTTMEEFIKASFSVKKRPKGFIIDLRGNGGGFMEAAVMISDIFLEKGETIVSVEGLRTRAFTQKATGKGYYRKGPVVILIDEWSASASEILAGALQDWDRAVVVGRRSFGKGLVQREFPLDDGSSVRLTVARYHTPTGRVVQSPYEQGGREDYYRRAEERYLSGSAAEADSTAAPDSLCYQTLKLGRTVYGGGGIRPDVTVERDTTGYSEYYGKMVAFGLMTDYANDFIDAHRSELSDLDWKKFEKVWKKLEKEAFDGLVAYCGSNGLKPDEEQLARSGELIRLRLKALVARCPMGTTGYYRVINSGRDADFAKAVEIISNWKGDFPSL